LFEILLYTGSLVSGEEKWVNVEVVAEYIGVRRESIYRWIDRRGFPAHRVGRLLRFRLSEVDQWVRTSGSRMGEREGCSQNEANDAQSEEEPTI
jgi:excisionase family DNA binding protein